MKRISTILALLVALCVLLSVSAMAATYTDGDNVLEIADDGTFVMETAGQNMDGGEFRLTVTGVQNADGSFTINGVFDGDLDLTELASEAQIADNLATVEATYAAGASGEPSGDVSGEASGEAMTAEEAFIEYIHEWLHAELEVNGNMTIEQVEDEFMPLVREMNFVDFPAEMIYSGMLEQGVPMTFEEFAAQYVPAAAPAGGGYSADEAGYKAYLKDWVAANPAVQANIDDFNAGIDAGAYGDFPMEMCFTDQWFGFAALTLDEFLAAGGVAEIPAFDPNLAPD